MTLRPNDFLHERYRIIQAISAGGMGAVYEALDSRLDTRCAVKENQIVTDAATKQFHREARILSQLRHPLLPRVTDHFFVPGQGQYLVMDYIEGEDLASRLKRLGPASEIEVRAWANDVLSALEYLHDQEVVHRDIKPANIRIDQTGRAILVDFGVAKEISAASGVTMTGARAFSPGFSPPEQYADVPGATTVQSDLYALGATMYTLLAGQAPAAAIPRLTRQKELVPLESLRPEISASLAAVVNQALSIEPADRHPNPAAMRQALAATAMVDDDRTRVGGVDTSAVPHVASAAPSTPIPSEPAAPTEAPHRSASGPSLGNAGAKRKHGRSVLVAVAVVIAVISAYAAYLASRHQPNPATLALTPGDAVGLVVSWNGVDIRPRQGDSKRELPPADGGHLSVVVRGFTLLDTTLTVESKQEVAFDLRGRLPGSVKFVVDVPARIDLRSVGTRTGRDAEFETLPGTYEYEIAADGKTTKTGTVQITAGRERELSISLDAVPPPQPTTGDVELKVVPRDLLAAWALTSSTGFQQSGSGSKVLRQCEAGQYTVTWSPIEGWSGPERITWTLELAGGKRIVFSARYERIVETAAPAALEVPVAVPSEPEVPVAASGPRAVINRIWTEQSVTVGNEDGIRVNIDLQLGGIVEKPVSVDCTFTLENGQTLKGKGDGAFEKDGLVCVSTELEPTTPDKRYPSLQLWIPNSQLHVPKRTQERAGERAITVNLVVWGRTNGAKVVLVEDSAVTFAFHH